MSYYMPEVDISSLTPQLIQLSNEELKQLLNDESYQRLDEMIQKDLQQIQSLERERDLLIETNKTSAQKNLSREPTYRQKRQDLIDAHNGLKQLKEEIDRKKSRLSEVSRQTSLDTRLALMQTATAEAEEQSEDIANAFLASELDFESFIKEFISKRKLSHLRRIKTDKMIDCIRNQSQVNPQAVNPFAPQRPAPPPPPQQSLPFAVNPQGAQNFPPYPLYAPSMPMPSQQPLNYPYNPFR